jgi:uncharacterized protein (TIGR00106 family)
VYLAHLSVMGLPSDGASVGRYVRKAVEILRSSGLRHEVHAMGSEIEAPRLEQIFEVVRRMDEALGLMGAERVTISLKIDHRRDKQADLASKVRSARSQ